MRVNGAQVPDHLLFGVVYPPDNQLRYFDPEEIAKF